MAAQQQTQTPAGVSTSDVLTHSYHASYSGGRVSVPQGVASGSVLEHTLEPFTSSAAEAPDFVSSQSNLRRKQQQVAGATGGPTPSGMHLALWAEACHKHFPQVSDVMTQKVVRDRQRSPRQHCLRDHPEPQQESGPDDCASTLQQIACVLTAQGWP